MSRKKVKRKQLRPALVRSDELCKRLVIMAAFNLHSNPEARALVYQAVRQLRRLDAAAIKAGILSADDPSRERGAG